VLAIEQLPQNFVRLLSGLRLALTLHPESNVSNQTFHHDSRTSILKDISHLHPSKTTTLPIANSSSGTSPSASAPSPLHRKFYTASLSPFGVSLIYSKPTIKVLGYGFYPIMGKKSYYFWAWD
jgi:hypothetical protein